MERAVKGTPRDHLRLALCTAMSLAPVAEALRPSEPHNRSQRSALTASGADLGDHEAP